MSNTKKKLKDYLNKSMRKLKHRKGFGVHSPFAYSIITEVIEEKLPYYAYRRMLRTYDKQAPITHKVACLLLRLANRFRCRNVIEVGSDGGYSLLPLLLTDSRLVAHVQSAQPQQERVEKLLAWLPQRLPSVSYLTTLDELAPDATYDMMVVNANPYASDAIRPTPEQDEQAAQQLVDWVMAHVQDETVIFVHGIQPKHKLETFWDLLCDREDVSITMDLYDYGLAILKPRFFKQHYIVAF